MTTTDLIKLLKENEFGASGRPREIWITRFNEDDEEQVALKYGEELKFNSSGDGICGAELGLIIDNAT